MFSPDLRHATDAWQREVDAETVRLIESGTPPIQAVNEAIETVQRRRRYASIASRIEQLGQPGDSNDR